MVIKSKDKTRASQRKGALSNWKVWSLHPNIGCELLSLENWQDSRQVSEEERNQRRRLEEGDVGA